MLSYQIPRRLSESFDSKRIAKNSIYLYIRMLFTMWFNLWATRLVLTNLGVEDMGVYGVVGSIVGIFSVFSVGVTTAVQRFITYELGKPDGNINKVFSSSLNVILLLCLLVLLVLESIGVVFLNNGINIPEASHNAACWVYQFSILTTIVTLFSVPYNALIIAHERMGIFAVITTIQVLLNWGAAFCLSCISKNGRLVIYAMFLAIASILIQMLYLFYCHSQFKESKYKKGIDKTLMKQIGTFMGISTTSNILQTLSSQGIILVINWTFGVGLNAVYQIALQLKNAILSFGLNIFKAISPQITKTYADGNLELHKSLVYTGSKIEVYMTLFIMIPFLFRANYIIHLWLGNVPRYTIEFAIATVFLSLTYAAFEPIRASVLATNRISKFMIYPEVFYLLIIPVGFIVSKISNSPIMLIVTVVGLDIVTCFIRAIYALQVSPIKCTEILKKSLFPSIVVAITSSCLCYLLSILTSSNLVGLLILLVINSIGLVVIIYILGLNMQERNTCKSFIRHILHS
jgi:O-antigen/teichoic acid export membrane protein